MIVTRTPFRISFFGGGTDYPAWYEKYGGEVLATTIDKYCYISCRHLPPFFEHKHRIVYSRIESVRDISEIRHPAVRAVLDWAGVTAGLEIHHDGDLPARSGLGSSSSFTVGLIHALSALDGKMQCKEDLARNAIYIEQKLINECVGSQDQISAAFGGFNHIVFRRNGSFEVNPVVATQTRIQQLQSHLMLLFTGVSRIAATVAKSKVENLESRKTELEYMRSLVHEALQILHDETRPIAEFGELLDAGWKKKRQLSEKVSSPVIDEIYEKARAHGALGGKLLGAGGGGFMLLFAKPEDHERIRAALADYVHVPFGFDDSGSRVVLYRPNGL